MSTEEYSMSNQMEKGEKGEKELDEYYSQWFYSRPVSMNAQRSGIDRAWTSKNTKHRYSVEYKSDDRAATSGNVFIETVSVDKNDKPGWAYSSCAQLLIYYIPPLKKAIRYSMLTLKFHVEDWVNTYPEHKIPNDGYYTVGTVVPIEEFEKYCWTVDNLGDIDNG
jgi:hypothetical protein